VTVVDAQGRPEPPSNGDEAATLVGFLEFQRATLAWKTAGLDASGLTKRVAASSMTLAGILKHLALVEEWWFSHWLYGRELQPPWQSVDFDADPDWEWRTAVDESPDELRLLWQRSVERSRSLVEQALAEGGPGFMALRGSPDGKTPSLRWILCHMVEEYSRHNGHADLIRESVDGLKGE
jgi:uncharacterized damage-inducible protein DinB